MSEPEPPSSRSSTALPLGPVVLVADIGVGWLLYAHVDPTLGALLWAVAALLTCSLFADASRSVTAVVRRSIRADW